MSRHKVETILVSLSVMFCIISFAVIFTVFFTPLYEFEIGHLNIVENSGYTKDIILKNYHVLIQYQSIFFQKALHMPDFIMSSGGRIHFEEVKRIFDLVQIIFGVTFITSIFGIFYKKRQRNFEYLKYASIFMVTIPSILALLASIDFDTAFIIFHKIFFRNDYWVFNENTDPVISILPQDFFMHAAMLMVAIVVISSIVLYLIYIRKVKQEERIYKEINAKI